MGVDSAWIGGTYMVRSSFWCYVGGFGLHSKGIVGVICEPGDVKERSYRNQVSRMG